MNRTKRILLSAGVSLILLGGLAYFGISYLNNSRRNVPLLYSQNAQLLELWNTYKKNNIDPNSNRTIDKSQDNITTSEGQSYTMLRAVWIDDKATFDKSWDFTKNNLQRPDHLMSWKYGKMANGQYGILTDIGGQNTASDADVDIALSLMMAYSRWNDASYLYQAKQIINSIWDNEVVTVQGKPILTADDLEKNSPSTVVVNPSYFSPYSFKLFAMVDKTHNWTGLVNSSYDLLGSLSSSSLGSSRSSGLAPNWITIDRTTGAQIPNASPNLDTNYGYDAMRISWRLALDYKWFKDPRDVTALKKFSFLSDQWNKNQSLKTVYAHDGTVVGDYESPAMYGTAIGYFITADPKLAKSVYDNKLQTLYTPDRQSWVTQLRYYDDNWAWFGIALYQDALPNLALQGN